jgi:ATP-dependent Clp protease ATP-binding subunit ClpA
MGLLFSECAKYLLVFAKMEAIRRGHAKVAPSHLLHAFFKSSSRCGRALIVLSQLEIDIQALEAWNVAALDGTHCTRVIANPKGSADLRRVVQLAMEETRCLRMEQVTSGVVFYALLFSAREPLATVLLAEANKRDEIRRVLLSD